MRGIIRLGNYVLQAYDVDVAPHMEEFELFESYDGIIAIKKQLDRFQAVKFKVDVTPEMLQEYTPGDDEEKYRSDFVRLRKKFLSELNGKVFVCASEMFPAFKGVVTAKEYRIEAGYEHATYDIEVKEVI